MRRPLTCNCCGGPAGCYKQHYNQDDGYGICSQCVHRHYVAKGVSPEEIERLFGKAGVNYARPKPPAKNTCTTAGQTVLLGSRL